MWIIIVYVISSIYSRRSASEIRPGKKKRGPVKKFIWGTVWGLTAALVADQLSPAEPAWLALTYVVSAGGLLYPFYYFVKNNAGIPAIGSDGDAEGEKRRIQTGLIGLGVYFGGVLYLDPLSGCIALALALEIFFIGKDILTGVMAFIGLIPVLFKYHQLNGDFLWASLGTELVFALYFRYALWKRFHTAKNKPPHGEETTS